MRIETKRKKTRIHPRLSIQYMGYEFASFSYGVDFFSSVYDLFPSHSGVPQWWDTLCSVSHCSLRTVPAHTRGCRVLRASPCPRRTSLSVPPRFPSRYVAFCMKRVNLLLHHGVQPVVVFDGASLPMKRNRNSERRRYVCGSFRGVMGKPRWYVNASYARLASTIVNDR